MKRFITASVFWLCIAASGRAEYNKDVTIEPLLKTETTSSGQKIIYPSAGDGEVTILKVTIPPGKSTGWHKHAFPVFAYILKGTLTVELQGGGVKQFPENTSFAEVTDTFHNGKNDGASDVVLIAFFMGEKGEPLSQARDATK